MLDNVNELLDAKDYQLADKEQNIGKLSKIIEHYEKKFGPPDTNVLDAIEKKYAIFAVEPKPKSKRFVIDLCKTKNRFGKMFELPSLESVCHKLGSGGNNALNELSFVIAKISKYFVGAF